MNQKLTAKIYCLSMAERFINRARHVIPSRCGDVIVLLDQALYLIEAHKEIIRLEKEDEKC